MSQSDFVTRGQALVSSGQFQEAVKVCRLGLLGRPTTVEGRVVLGQALLALKRYDEVLAEMRVALELDHSSVSAQVLKGEALLRKGDGHSALEVFLALRSTGTADARASELLAEAERMLGRAPQGNPAIDFIAQDPTGFGVDQGTKNYPAHMVASALAGEAGGEGGGEFTKPTTLAPAPRRSEPMSPFDVKTDATPPPAVLAVGDRSGTVEVDPDVEGLELRGDDDFGPVAGPPVGGRGGAGGEDAVTRERQSMRGLVKKSSRSRPDAKKSKRAREFKEEVSTVELDDDEMIEIDETLMPDPRREPFKKAPGRGTAVRNAVQMPSGPIDQPSAMRATQSPPATQGPLQLEQMISSRPGAAGAASAPQPQPPSPSAQGASPGAPGAAPGVRGAVPAALPTAATMPPQMLAPLPVLHSMPPESPPISPVAVGPAPMPLGPSPLPPTPLSASRLPLGGGAPAMPANAPMQLPSNHAAMRPTIAVSPAAGPDPYNGRDGEPAWARATVIPGGQYNPAASRAAPDEPTRRPAEIDPQIAAMLINPAGEVGSAFAPEASSVHSVPQPRRRSRLQIALWVMIGALVIGGGVFAGFQIRALRLHKQIAAARDRAVDLAKADTWQGWLGARDSLYGIAQASPTADNRAALARVRALVAYEFGDGTADAKAAVDRMSGQSSLDLDLAIAYLALARSDVKTAREAAERAVQASADDPAAHYVSGQAALMSGDAKSAVADLKRAFEREPRPLYAIAWARALANGSAWDDALAALERAGDNPTALIAKAGILIASGRIAGGPGSEIRAQLGKLIAEGSGQTPGPLGSGTRGSAKPATDQTRPVSPLQVAFADLALAQVELSRGEPGVARAALLASLGLNLNDQRFAEEFGEAAYALGELDTARKAAVRALETGPTSRRARTTLAQVWLALGQPTTALELFTKSPDAAGWAKGQTVRGQAHLAAGEIDSARADFDLVLKKNPGFEPALVARAWLDLANGDVDDARQRIEAKMSPKGATTAMVAVYAAILRATGDPGSRTKAKGLLERVLAGPPSLDTPRAQLELARIDRDLGDVRGARAAYAEASRGGNFEARLESGLLQIEDRDPRGGRAALEQLLKDAGDHPSGLLLVEAARARMLMGDHPGAADLLARAEKAGGAPRWQLARERGRLALRKNDIAAAAQALVTALEGCGGDIDTFILAADTVSTDDKQTQLAQKLKSLVPTRLKGLPEIQIIEGKLDLATGKRDDAEKIYKTAKDTLAAEKASSRRLAQADFGRAAVAYEKEDDQTALSVLDLVLFEDPSIYSAYLFAAEIWKTKGNPRKALELAQQAALLNPDWVEAWKLIGPLAAQLNNRRLLADAIQRLTDLAPGSDLIRQLKQAR
ncbi:MAG TPA: CDC27 family protein [Kofleriaceae bacterium]|nr:CDC27 family protein [Kofleriaceae bacterium]